MRGLVFCSIVLCPLVSFMLYVGFVIGHENEEVCSEGSFIERIRLKDGSSAVICTDGDRVWSERIKK